MIATIAGRRWPSRPARVAVGAAWAGLNVYHLQRQGLYAWAVVLFTFVSTAFVLRALRPFGPVWSVILEEDDPCSSVTRRTGSGPALPSPRSSPRVPVGSTRR